MSGFEFSRFIWIKLFFTSSLKVGFLTKSVGWFLMLLSPFTELFSFDVTVFNFFLLGFVSSGTSYILTTLFGDDGVKHEHKLD